MKRYVLQLLGSIAMVAAVITEAADQNVATLPGGSYISFMGGFAPQESVELGLHSDGRATYIITRRETASPTSRQQRQIIFGRWQEDDGIVTVRVDQDGKLLSIEYKVVECLRYEYNTEVRCSSGIEPMESAEPHVLTQSFWSVVTVGKQFERP